MTGRQSCCVSPKFCLMKTDVLLSLHQIRIAYGHHVVVSDFSMEVCKGQVWVLTGRNGGGKTSLLRVMAGLWQPQGGTVQRCEDLSVGVLPQITELDRSFPITVEEVVRSGCQESLFPSQKQKEHSAVICAQVMERLALTSLAHNSVRELSGGQWQRTLLARAIVGQPQLLLLDEPDTYLDVKARHELYETLHHLRKFCSMVIVSHDPDIVQALPGALVKEVGG